MTLPCRRRRAGFVLLATIMGSALHGPPAGAGPPDGFTAETVLTGLSEPVAIEWLPDGRYLLAQRGGSILIVDDGTATPYMTVPETFVGFDQGVLNIAVPPDFADSPCFYVYHAHAPTGSFQVVRFNHLGNSGDPASRTLVWRDSEPISGPNHFGGGMGFDLHGLLYLTVGEEFDDAQAQDLTRSGGSVIRVAPNGVIPADNPFIDGTGGNDDSIWGLGLRNPFRASWDHLRGHLFVADVGAGSWEEISIATSPGPNFGWPQCQGACGNPNLPGYVEPVLSYPHIGGAAVIGGVVYRGGRFPTDPFYGAYFYGDYAQGCLRYLTLDESGTMLTGDFDFDTEAVHMTDFATGPDGALYVVGYVTGVVVRYDYDDGNSAPAITQAAADVTAGPAPLAVSFTAAAFDGDDDPLDFRWHFGDGAEADGPQVDHVYATGGIFHAFLEVSDGSVVSLSEPIEIRAGTPPTLAITSPRPSQLFSADQVVTFAGTISDAEDDLGADDMLWLVRRVQDDDWAWVAGPQPGASGSFTTGTNGAQFAGDSGYEIILTAVDSDGFIATASVLIAPEKVDLTIATAPAGLRVFVDGTLRTTPHVLDALIGAEHILNAPTPQCSEGQRFIFDQWSDGGDQSHTIVVPDIPGEVVATYTAGGDATGDADFDGIVGVNDLIAVVLAWGPCPGGDIACAADFDCTGEVDVNDLITIIFNWND